MMAEIKRDESSSTVGLPDAHPRVITMYLQDEVLDYKYCNNNDNYNDSIVHYQTPPCMTQIHLPIELHEKIVSHEPFVLPLLLQISTSHLRTLDDPRIWKYFRKIWPYAVINGKEDVIRLMDEEKGCRYELKQLGYANVLKALPISDKQVL